MRSGPASWVVTEDLREDLCTLLYVRDACGLDGPDVAGVAVPPLTPGVAVNAPPPAPGAHERWMRLWRRSLGDAAEPPGTDTEPRRLAADFGVPFDDLVAWLGRRKRRYVAEQVGSRRPLVYNRAVDDVAGWLGRPVPDFELSVGVLPVAGRWMWRVRPALLLCSEELRYDDEAFGRLAVEVVAVLVT